VEYLWKRAVLKRAAYHFLDIAVTMTDANARLVAGRQGVAPSRVRVIANGITRDFGASGGGKEKRWALGLRDTQVLLLYVGNILPHKGLRRLIEAIPRSALRSHLHLAVAGAGADEAACRQLAADRGLSGQVTFLGWRSAAETEALLAAADVLALPSEIEGLPYVLLEAMASGVPVIAGRVYGIPEVVEDGITGLLVDPHNIDDIARALDRMADPDLRHKMGAAARERFERRFTLEEQAARMQSLYRTLLNGARVTEAS
jgi:glycosyltransferase involved in cell wall biosynthesis